MRPTRLIAWGALLALVAASIAVYPSLPAEIPQHIGADGRAGRFTPRTPMAWGFPLLIALACAALVDVVAAKLPSKPQLFNFPGKEQLLKLPAEYRREAIARMQRFMDVVLLQVVATFALVQWMMWRGAHGQDNQTGTMILLMVGPVLLIAAGLYTVRIQGAVDEAQRRYESRRNPKEALRSAPHPSDRARKSDA
jgi:uncharacterized membrane protein